MDSIFSTTFSLPWSCFVGETEGTFNYQEEKEGRKKKNIIIAFLSLSLCHYSPSFVDPFTILKFEILLASKVEHNWQRGTIVECFSRAFELEVFLFK